MSWQDIVPLCLSEIIGDTGFKWFANQGGTGNFAIGSAGYVSVIYFLIRSLQGSSLIVVNTSWDGLSALIESLYALLLLGERYDEPIKYVGLALILLGLFFLKIPWKESKPFRFPPFFNSGAHTL
jgi:multidrug transporter EmrE-like cation transporter